jgi:hypothetical protein
MLENNTMNIRAIENQFNILFRRKLALDPEFNKLKDELDTINIQIAGLDQALRAAGVDTTELRKNIAPHVEVEEKETPRRLPDEIARLLGDVKKPLHYKNITHILLTSGFPIPGQYPENTVSAYLNRHKNRFAKVPEMGRGYYKLKE